MTSSADGPTPTPVVRFRERLTVPWWSWLAAAFWAATLGIAFGHSLGTPVGTAVGIGCLGLAAAGLVSVSTVVVVDDDALRVGNVALPLRHVGQVSALHGDEARRRRGPEADPRTWPCVRGWISGAVLVEVVDERDPTPSWYVSTRRPDALARALADAVRRGA